MAKEEQEMADKIKEKWEALFFEASEVDHNLGGTKKMFTEVVFVIKLTPPQKKERNGKENNLNSVLSRLQSNRLRTTLQR